MFSDELLILLYRFYSFFIISEPSTNPTYLPVDWVIKLKTSQKFIKTTKYEYEQKSYGCYFVQNVKK